MKSTPSLIPVLLTGILLFCLVATSGCTQYIPEPVKSWIGQSGSTGPGSQNQPGGPSLPGISVTCPAGKVLCGVTCQDLNTDLQNCGSCGKACAAGYDTCLAGRCAEKRGNQYYLESPCPEGTLCKGRCVNLQVSNLNCGSCGNFCQHPTTCVNGACVEKPATCTNMGESVCSGKCVYLDTSFQNCGGCGKACPAGQICHLGVCVPFACEKALHPCKDYFCCSEGFDDPCLQIAVGEHRVGTRMCNYLCTDTQTDQRNCGSCGNDCGEFSVCSGGACVQPTGFGPLPKV